MIQCRFARFVAMLVGLSLVVPVSRADNFPDYPVRAAGDYTVKAEKGTLVVAVQIVEDPKEQETYFHTKLAPKGFLPLFIVVQNGSTTDSFLFDKTKITIGRAGASGKGPQVNSKAGEITAIGSLAAISMVGALIAMKLMANATHVQQNILKKEIQSKTLSPGESVHGFLYLAVPKNAPRESTQLRVPLAKSGTDETLNLDLVF